jgi:hypothetical protein
MGSSTGPWGRINVDALALLVWCGSICQVLPREKWLEGSRRTEQRALMSKVNADGLDVEAILQVPNA